MTSVTYIVTIYNKAPYILDVLKAIRTQQGDFDRQYVLVDDGSTDGSGDIAAAEIANWPNAILIRQKNQGPSSATNRGLAEANMDYIHIVDADDILAPYATKLLLKVAKQTGCGLVYGRGSWYDKKEDIKFPEEPKDVDVRILDDTLFTVMRTGLAGSSALLLDTACFKRVGGCDPRIFVQDQSLPQRMAQVATIGVFDNLISLGPENEPGRLMKSHAQQLHDQSLTALNMLCDNPQLPHRFRKLVQKQVTGRAWKWATRRDNVTFMSAAFVRFLLARIPGVNLSDTQLYATLQEFRRNNPVRLMSEK